ncbi:uncharacterized protein (TIGR02118 family) [Jatrophihabitans sp. GAS493]|uniref:EthD domain-containing protein n=1 Tax=Jatrophihabitans sp. GAS493 TaxID=1907575 RepID=UPI000BB96D15|nr:EthD domain-containing protein [Jatrophihabitans sp. GAS493]SOD74671.1 uncharacterized protein (TIGR02118 family) [Jatrophihabitans sp. GAS493]
MSAASGTAQVKLLFCLRRRADLTREEFQEYWQGSHGKLGVELADDLGFIRYVQSHTLSAPLNDALQASRSAPPAYDGVVELWFESVEAVERTFSTPKGRAAARRLVEDESNFVDVSASPIFLVSEHGMYEKPL